MIVALFLCIEKLTRTYKYEKRDFSFNFGWLVGWLDLSTVYLLGLSVSCCCCLSCLVVVVVA